MIMGGGSLVISSISIVYNIYTTLYIIYYITHIYTDEDDDAPTTYMSKDQERAHRLEMKMKKLYRFAEVLPQVMSFLEVGQVSHSAVVSRHYNYGCSMYKYYTDVRDCVPWNVSVYR